MRCLNRNLQMLFCISCKGRSLLITNNVKAEAIYITDEHHAVDFGRDKRN